MFQRLLRKFITSITPSNSKKKQTKQIKPIIKILAISSRKTNTRNQRQNRNWAGNWKNPQKKLKLNPRISSKMRNWAQKNNYMTHQLLEFSPKSCLIEGFQKERGKSSRRRRLRSSTEPINKSTLKSIYRDVQILYYVKFSVFFDRRPRLIWLINKENLKPKVLLLRFENAQAKRREETTRRQEKGAVRSECNHALL